MSAFYNYSEPFSCECRAFARLQETGHDELALQCFGYILLDEKHEQIMMSQFKHLRELIDLEFNGSLMQSGHEDLRSRFLGRDGRPPPIRGIVKEFGHVNEEVGKLGTRDARRILRDVIQLQQLGIFNVDVASRQIISGKLCDFSTAVTSPHFLTNPELNPQLSPEWISAMEFETFQFAVNDYWQFDEMVFEWNAEHEKEKIACCVFATHPSHRTRYNLRSTPSRGRAYTLVDPRLYQWKTVVSSPKKIATRAMVRKRPLSKNASARGEAVSKASVRLQTKPPRWYLNCSSEVAADLKISRDFSTSLHWYYQDGLIFPRKKQY